MYETILKIGRLDLDLQGQENVFEFYFLLFNKISKCLGSICKTGDLDLDLQGQTDPQGQTCHESSNISLIPCDFLVKF